MVISVALALFGIATAYTMYVAYPRLAGEVGSWYPRIYRVLLNKYYVDELYATAILRPGMALANRLSAGLDRLLTEGIPGGAGRAVQACSFSLRPLQSGLVRDYALAMMAGTVALVAYLLSQIGGSR